jgi:hypothetical protein
MVKRLGTVRAIAVSLGGGAVACFSKKLVKVLTAISI